MPILDIASSVPVIWEKIAETRTAIINRDGYLQACNFEICLNLDLLDSLNTEPQKVNAKSPAFRELVNSLEINAILALLAGNDRRSYRRFIKLLKKHWNKSVSFEQEEDIQIDSVQNVLDALGFIVRKIEALRRIARISETDEEIFKTINLNTRLKNIKKALLEVQELFKDISKYC